MCRSTHCQYDHLFFSCERFQTHPRRESTDCTWGRAEGDRQVTTVENRHADLVFLDTKDRLIRFIKNWARSDGNRIGDKIILNNYLTHSDIAGFIATSRQSVNMLLNELRSSGLLCYNRKHIELNNPIVWN